MATPDKIEQRLREILSKVAPRVKERAAVGEDEGDAVPLSADELKRIFGKVRTKLGLPYAAIEEPMEAEERSTMSRYLSSGFDALDNLLGGDGFQKGASILLRGQAGTGKTTLALQIAKNAIDKQGHAFVYASVEDPPEVLLNHITRSFWDVDFEAFLGDPKQWAVENLTEYWDIDVNKTAYIRLLEEFINEHSDKFDMEEQNALRQYPDELRPLMDEILGPERLRDAIRERMREMELDRLLCKLWERIPIFDARPIILVVDSLNALINGAKTRFRNYTDRQMLLSVHQSFETWRRKKRDQLTVLFIVEDDPNVATAAAESYVADVIIDLVFEEVPITPDDRGGLSQQMRFCRVLKGRGLPTQTRSCCYEFVKGDQNENSDERGIKFFPTYAAPGIVYLFHENKPQLDDIEALRTIDMRSDFPRVQVEDFTRSGLQRMFSVHRHSKRIPLRQPLLLSHVDEYWVVALKEAGLLLPIPSRDLLPHSMRLQDSGTSGKGTQFIKELTNKTNMFCGKDRHNNAAHYAVPHMANVGILVYRKD
ncbi:MAG: hypothetical protein IH991_06845, partial [Planctomycetes bacterium]|nr:hypothetical protein [Planctomycetota bacterium]